MKLREAFFKELPGEKQFIDYGLRTDGQPVYTGHAVIAEDETSLEWTISFYKYSGDSVIAIYCLKGSWAARVALFLEYA